MGKVSYGESFEDKGKKSKSETEKAYWGLVLRPK